MSIIGAVSIGVPHSSVDHESLSDESTSRVGHHDLLWPAVAALRNLGGSASIEELNEAAVKSGGSTEVQQAIPRKDGPSTEIEYRIAWARTYLKVMGPAALERLVAVLLQGRDSAT